MNLKNKVIRFKAYIPYSQLDIDIIESIGGSFQEFYPTIEALIEEEPEAEFTEVEIDGLAIQLDCGNWLSMDSIGLN